MSGHPDLRPLLDRADRSSSERQDLLTHVRDCAPCRAELAGRDPSLLFALLALEPVPDNVLERVSDRAEAALELDRQATATRRLQAWGSLAASIMVAGILGAYLWTQTGPTTPPPMRPGVAEVLQRPLPEAAIPAGMIELLDSPGKADLVEMTVGEVDVVMIFDEAMGI